jgi:hypothetical protein
MRLYVVENIRSASVGKESFVRDSAFDLKAFADRAFGVFQNEDEFGEVVWRFLPEAAAHARGFEFHRSQQMEEQADGSLIVRFVASGHLEMCGVPARHGARLAPLGLPVPALTEPRQVLPRTLRVEVNSEPIGL